MNPMIMTGYMTERAADTDGWKTRAKFKTTTYNYNHWPVKTSVID